MKVRVDKCVTEKCNVTLCIMQGSTLEPASFTALIDPLFTDEVDAFVDDEKFIADEKAYIKYEVQAIVSNTVILPTEHNIHLSVENI